MVDGFDGKFLCSPNPIQWTYLDCVKYLTQESLAIKIGVSRQTINSIEKNRYVPSSVLALKIANVFGKSVEEIFELEEEN